MTITSTANSGGGLPDFGVFQNQKVYTVYLDMRSNDEDRIPSWTLEYAPLPAEGAERVGGTPTPPYATLKELPELTPELAVKYAHKLIIASAILNVAGRLEQISVKQSPDPEVIATLLEALNNWTFEPSQIDGKPIALKILLGIRLAR
jgi:Lhr-like helicase